MIQASFLRIAPLLAVAGAAFAQTGAAPASSPVSFEVASVKASAPLDAAAIVSGKAHVGTTIDKARVDIGSTPMIGLICQAYKVKPYQITGGPNWLYTERYDIVAKLPEGADKDQVPAMLQTLLAERFKLALHRDKRDTPVYALTVGKGGLKMKEAAPAAETAAASAGPGESGPAPAPAKGEIVMGGGDNQVRMKQTGNGMTVSSKETGNMRVTMDNGVIHMEFENASIEMLVSTLSQYLDRPVVDQTELKGKYQAALDITLADAMRVAQKLGVVPMGAPAAPAGNANAAPAEAASDPSASSLFSSIQQLGLKLEPRKLPYEFLAIDHLEKTPTEN